MERDVQQCQRSLEPPAEFRGVTRAVEDRDHTDEIGLNVEVNAVFLEAFKLRYADGPADKAKASRMLKDVREDGLKLGLKPVAQARLLLVVPRDCFFKLQPRFRVEDYCPLQGPLFPSRSLRSARTLSQGIPLSGYRRRASARFSSSATCAGVKSSPACSKSSRNSLHTCSTRSRLSTGLRPRICSRISAALTRLIYRLLQPRQVAIAPPIPPVRFHSALA